MATDGVDVVIVDDHHLYTRGLALLLDTAGDGRIRVVATTGDGSRAVGLVRDSAPDIALIDLQMPAPGALAVIGGIKRASPHVRVLAIADRQSRIAPVEALRAGAEGYLPKTAEPDDLVHPLVSLLHGYAVLPSWLLVELLRTAERPSAALVDGLDPDQRQLWAGVARGLSVQAIAREHHVSERTAKRMTARLLHAIGARNRIEAAALAGRCGLLEPR